ncbi:AraC family ligand binding domain-containing protein [uncultured Catenibacterium sp.]|uniref:AraC family ligand binding domain-containing protein n=1 Tax=uncultured Catenibacterium sp. TaxID=286142 RepID=UPI0025F8D77A|nr:AraC family ligand binding domain-containing protein [uncultured Catenibacterium sp.]
MKYKPILEMLEKYNEDEKLFKEFYYMEKNPLNIQKFKEKYKHQEEDINTVLAPSKLPSNRREDDFIKKGNNISVIKHPRYVPFYLHDHAYFEMIYVVKGECIHRLENNKSTLKAGDICILAPNVKHGIKVFDDSIIINILIRQSTFLDIFMNYLRDKSQIGSFFYIISIPKRK